MPMSNVRDTLGDFVNQYAGYAQTTTTLGLFNGRPAADAGRPVPGQQPGDRALRAGATAATPTSAAPSASTSTSCGRRSTTGSTCRTSGRSWAGIVDGRRLLLQLRHAGCPYTLEPEHDGPGVQLRATEPLLNTQVANPFRNYLTPTSSRGRCATTRRSTLGSLLVPYPQYGTDHPDQHERRPQHEDAQLRRARAAAVHQGRELPGRLRVPAGPRSRSGSTTSTSTRC